jgi:hypothetical protein
MTLPTDAAKVKTNTRRKIKSEAGARAILELLTCYDTHWVESRDFKDDLIGQLRLARLDGNVASADRVRRVVCWSTSGREDFPPARLKITPRHPDKQKPWRRAGRVGR